MLVSKNPRGPNAKPDRPNAKPGKPNMKPGRSNASPNASWWNIVQVGYARVCFTFAMYISCCLCEFRSRWRILVEYRLNTKPMQSIQLLLTIHNMDVGRILWGNGE